MTTTIRTSDFHPKLCADCLRARVVSAKTDAVIAIFVSHVASGNCIITCYVYDFKAWDRIFSKIRIAEAVHATGLAYVTREHREHGWV